ncbi:uncharacterized protein BDR25DRAFT_309424 [Lindgomyces ingoldianus]|uniref:Uncharacterized protein n=1 Tax=Lindgomyces ingoldianus TaxID=673940 RepID=A0ACB6RFM5_9PLEO|nr:uncharacterized protein BDR25DRAFT_309424 [Lindgomyces ingoldianus]KAF2477127.1 hypothetical protein BDR25DRAFT_309424 [Lindgomyces ingoldianus]
MCSQPLRAATTAVSINTYDKNGETPIHHVVAANIAELVRLLLAKGANSSQRPKAEQSRPDNTAIEGAAIFNQTSAFKPLLNSGTPVSSGALEAFTSQGNLDAVTIFLNSSVGDL